jgi:ribosomal protein S18 acetylase RimI-like enzyme
MEITSYTKDHLDGVVQLSNAEGWPTFAENSERTHRALVAPGVSTVVALSGKTIVGFAQVQSDGEIQAHLSVLIVAKGHRRQGIGRQLLYEAFTKSGGIRLDLLTDSGEAFYESLPHKTFHGYRIYPS